MKRLLAILLVVFMVAAVCPLAFAADTEIKQVDIINADVTPIWGAAYDVNLDYELADDTGFIEYGHYWYNEETWETDFDAVLPGNHYSMCWDFEPEEGYYFSENTKITINGSDAIVDYGYTGIDSYGDLVIWTNPQLPVEGTEPEILVAPVDNVPLIPETGKTAAECAFEPKTTSAKYTIDDWGWFCDSDNESMNDSDVFDAEKEYSIWVDLLAKDGYYFDSYVIATINGSVDNVDFSSIDGDNDEWLTVWTPKSFPMDLDNAPEAYLLYDGINESTPGIYKVDMTTGAMAQVHTFGGDTLFAMEKINGKYYGYTEDFDYVIIDAETFKVEYFADKDDIGGPTVNDMTVDTDTGIIYSVQAGNKTLSTINPTTGENTVVAELDFAPITIAYADGFLYCTEYSSNNIRKIDTKDYKATEFATLDEGVSLGYIQTMDYNPADECLYTLGYDTNAAGFIAKINLDGTVENEFSISEVEFGGLCFTNETVEFPEIKVEGIALDKTELTLGDKGNTSAQLKVTFTPANATNKNVTWTTSDDKVATVEKGLVTAVAEGEATITVTSEDGGFTATCKVTVEHKNFLLYEDFENFDEKNWTFVDADGDGNNWTLLEQNADGGMKIYEGTHCIVSQSYINGEGALTPDNWMISQPFTATADAMLSWVDAGQDASYADENYSVYVLPANYTNVSEGTEVYNGMPTGEFNTRTVDLSKYAGQEIRIAFRHFNVTDMYWLNIDLITVTGTTGEVPPVKEFTVTFVDGVTNETIKTVKVEEGKDVADTDFPEAPEHEGYEFKGWDKDGKNITEDTTITAQYEKIEEPPVEVVIGDVDGNGKIDTFDAVVILKFAAEMVTLDENQTTAADVNFDGKVNTADAVLILKYAAGMLPDGFVKPVE